MNRRRATIYIVRHGATAWNEAGRIVGHADVGLSHGGRLQAEGARSLLGPCRLDLVLTSPLRRTRETARCLIEGRQVELEEEERLIELALGSWEGLTRADLRSDPEWQRWIATPHTAATPEGKTLAEVQARATAALDDGLRRVPDGGGLVVVTHGGVARVLILDFLGMPLSAYHKLRCDCASVTAVEVDAAGELRRVLALNLTDPPRALGNASTK